MKDHSLVGYERNEVAHDMFGMGRFNNHGLSDSSQAGNGCRNYSLAANERAKHFLNLATDKSRCRNFDYRIFVREASCLNINRHKALRRWTPLDRVGARDLEARMLFVMAGMAESDKIRLAIGPAARQGQNVVNVKFTLRESAEAANASVTVARTNFLLQFFIF